MHDCPRGLGQLLAFGKGVGLLHEALRMTSSLMLSTETAAVKENGV